MSNAVTRGIQVQVEARYVPQHSDPRTHRYVFAYTVSIENVGDEPATLEARHWVITDANGSIEEVKGQGVVGETPRLVPGQSFEYTSGCVLRTPFGTMHGSYRMLRDDREWFEAEIAPFVLAAPAHKSTTVLN